MRISDDYVLIEKIEEPKTEGFKTVEVQDSFVYKGKIKLLPARPVYIGNEGVSLGQVVLFKKYSPDTFDYEGDKFVTVTDLLAVL